MTQEQKAKKYDEALEWMRELYPGLHGATKEDAEHYFPELKESEDERMLRVIRLALTDVPEERFTTEGTSFLKVLAWLEKQKEQKPVTINQDEKEFLADEITAFLCNYDKEFDGEDPVPSEVAEHFYLLGKQAQEQKPAEWSEEDEHRCSDAIYFLETAKKHYADTSEIELTIDWLKSLRPQPKQKPEAKLTGWVARDSKYNSYFGLGLVLFKGKPRRSGECWSGAIAAQLPWELFPDLKWMNEPMEVEVTIRRK